MGPISFLRTCPSGRRSFRTAEGVTPPPQFEGLPDPPPCAKPGCDGTHLKGFDGTETAKEPVFEKVDGPFLTMDDAPALCAAARFCHKGGGVWGLVESGKSKETAVKAICDCPSGRLVVRDKKIGKVVEPKFEKSIGLIEDPDAGVSGPIWVKGGVLIVSSSGKEYKIRNRVTLCRCFSRRSGKSRKPAVSAVGLLRTNRSATGRIFP